MTQPLNDSSHPPKVSALAVLAFVLSFFSFCLSIFVGIPVLILANYALNRIYDDPDHLAGAGYGHWAIRISLIGMVVTIAGYLMIPYIRIGHGEPAARSACSANLKGIITSMVVYGNENNDKLPLGAPPAELFTYHVNTNINTYTSDSKKALAFMQSPAMAGNIYSTLWILVLTQQVSPKSFICRDDPFTNIKKFAQTTDRDGRYFATFQRMDQVSYSVAYPWAENPQTGKIENAPSWRNTIDSNLPVMSDMAPLNGTGKPAADVTLLPPKAKDHGAASSFNHKARYKAGQNIGYADAHVEWSWSPVNEWTRDNIFTSGGKPGDDLRIDKAPWPGRIEPIITSALPFDVVMTPLRDGNTGKIR